jgi:hypothetical protein
MSAGRAHLQREVVMGSLRKSDRAHCSSHYPTYLLSCMALHVCPSLHSLTGCVLPIPPYTHLLAMPQPCEIHTMFSPCDKVTEMLVMMTR